MPALEGGESVSDRRTVGPVVTVPRIMLRPADEIEQTPARDVIVDKMGPGTDPGLVAEFEPEIRTVYGDMRRAVKLLAARIDPGMGERAADVPAPLGGASAACPPRDPCLPAGRGRKAHGRRWGPY